MSETGYVYVLSNEYIPKLVKIGYTNRNPSQRADELSNFTGVPGKWSVCKYWKLENAFEWEQKIFAALSKFRETGEFFTLTPKKASELIFIFLSNSGAISENGLTNPEKEEIDAARVLHAEFEEKTRQEGLEKQWKSIESEYSHKSLNEAESNLGVSLKEINARDIDPGTDIFETIGNMIFVICIPIIFPLSLLLSLFGITLFDSPKSKAPSIADRQRDRLFKERDKIFEAYKNNFFAPKARTNVTREIQAHPMVANKNDGVNRLAPINSKQTLYTINDKPHVYDGTKFVKVANKAMQNDSSVGVEKNTADTSKNNASKLTSPAISNDEWRMTSSGLQNIRSGELVPTHSFEYASSPQEGYRIYSNANGVQFIPLDKVKSY